MKPQDRPDTVSPISSARGMKRGHAAAHAYWNDWPWGTLCILLFLAYGITVLANAWLADDAYITFRVVDNVIHGYGPVFNIGERVQAYTNPLMMLVISALSMVTREVYFTSLALSIVASLAAVGILAFRIARSRALAAIALVLLVLSSSFISYSTSGLENCLIFLLAALFFAVYFRAEEWTARDLLLLSGLVALSVVNRLDTGLLLAPALAFAFFRASGVSWPRRIGAIALGMLPFIAWEAFSLVYYGFPFPNTAYAKLNTGIALAEYLVRGVWYYIVTFLQDPAIILGIIAAGAVVALSRRAKTVVPLIGVVLYLGYIVYIGGDFMRGRYFTSPLFVVLLLLVSIDPAELRLPTLGGSWPRSLVVGALAIALLTNMLGGFYKGMSLESWSPYGIYDDRRIYFPASNLALNLVGPQLEKSPFVAIGKELRAEGPTTVVRATLGFTGYYAGPEVHIVDPLALSDALLARMPAITDPSWKIGHLERYVPDGYLETLESGTNQLEDPGLAEYYDHLSLVIRGPIWSAERWAAIRAINTGRYDGLIDQDRYRNDVENPFEIDDL